MDDSTPRPNPDPQPQGDPYTEPANSTIDDSFAQDVERDMDAADRALEDADGDAAKAEEIFEDTREPHRNDAYDVPADERP